ncbi:unnamed protein product [Penicillium nalgiovense]|nr:unnamed protein product [Penicillium nalgiovense]
MNLITPTCHLSFVLRTVSIPWSHATLPLPTTHCMGLTFPDVWTLRTCMTIFQAEASPWSLLPSLPWPGLLLYLAMPPST